MTRVFSWLGDGSEGSCVRASRRVRLLALLSVLALVAAACGGGDDADGGGTGNGAGGEVDLAAFCEGAIEGEARFTQGPELDEEGNPVEGSLDELSRDIEPHIQAIEENAPEEIESEVATVLEGVRDVLETGDEQVMQNAEFLEAETALDEYVYNNCEFDASQEFTAVNYAYEGVPASLSAGQVAFRMDNQGSEVHEAVFFRIDEGEERSVQQLLELPEEEGEELMEFQGVAFAPPGTAGYSVVDLDAGRYGMVCFIPVGTTSLDELAGPQGEESPEAGESPETTSSPTGSPTPTASPSPEAEDEEGEGEEEGPPPHFTRGMFAEFTVT